MAEWSRTLQSEKEINAVGYVIIYKTLSATEEVVCDLTVPVHSKCYLTHFVPDRSQ